MAGLISTAGWPDAGAYLARLVRLNPAALVRIQPLPAAGGVARLWGMLPFGVLVERVVAATAGEDTTVAAAALLATAGDPDPAGLPRRDAHWVWPLPPRPADGATPGKPVETVPALEIRRVAVAAAHTLKSAAKHGVGGRAVGERALRDALLDHVPVVVTGADGVRVDVPQRLVQGLVRMGFLGDPGDISTRSDASVTVRLAGAWIGLSGTYGSAWLRPPAKLRLN
jgi:hypothetical protein